jgi:hypothetical protein
MKKHQEQLLEFDPTLTTKELDLALAYSWSFCHDQVSKLEFVTNLKAQAHREAHLKILCQNSKTAGRCYRVGTQTWVRRDEKPLTEQDISSLKALCLGQITNVTAVTGDLQASVYWECDSSD